MWNPNQKRNLGPSRFLRPNNQPAKKTSNRAKIFCDLADSGGPAPVDHANLDANLAIGAVGSHLVT